MPWRDNQTYALNEMKQALCSATDCVLYIPDFNKPFKIAVDASDIAVAGCLSQQGDDDVEFPLSFFSLKLNGIQKTWAAIHKEA